MEEINAGLETYERMNHIIVCSEPWSIENNLLAHTLNIMRNDVEARYGAIIEQCAKICARSEKDSWNESISPWEMSMKLWICHAPNPKRVRMFMAEKNINNIELILVDLNNHQHTDAEYVAKSPLSRVPVLELDDGTFISESRAICTYLEFLVPENNLMGVDGLERARIEMADRLVEWNVMLQTRHWIRHCHPGLAVLEKPQFPAWGESQREKRRPGLDWLEASLGKQAFVAGERFTIADITAYCTMEFSRVMKFKPGEAGYPSLQAWRDRVAQRTSVSVGDS